MKDITLFIYNNSTNINVVIFLIFNILQCWYTIWQGWTCVLE